MSSPVVLAGTAGVADVRYDRCAEPPQLAIVLARGVSPQPHHLTIVSIAAP